MVFWESGSVFLEITALGEEPCWCHPFGVCFHGFEEVRALDVHFKDSHKLLSIIQKCFNNDGSSPHVEAVLKVDDHPGLDAANVPPLGPLAAVGGPAEILDHFCRLWQQEAALKRTYLFMRVYAK